jgi:hypothetical protein
MYTGVQYTVSSGVRNVQALSSCVVFCRSLYVVLFLVAIVLSDLLRFKACDYPVGIVRPLLTT